MFGQEEPEFAGWHLVDEVFLLLDILFIFIPFRHASHSLVDDQVLRLANRGAYLVHAALHVLIVAQFLHFHCHRHHLALPRRHALFGGGHWRVQLNQAIIAAASEFGKGLLRVVWPHRLGHLLHLVASSRGRELAITHAVGPVDIAHILNGSRHL